MTNLQNLQGVCVDLIREGVNVHQLYVHVSVVSRAFKKHVNIN